MGALVHSAREPAAPYTRISDPLLHMGSNLYVNQNCGRGPAMDLKVGLEALSKRSTFSTKRIAFLAIAGLCLVAGILLRSGQYFAPPEVEPNPPVAPSPSTGWRRACRPALRCGQLPGNGGTDVVRASALGCSGDFLLRLADCQGEDLIAEG